jgi:hypothetical protein
MSLLGLLALECRARSFDRHRSGRRASAGKERNRRRRSALSTGDVARGLRKSRAAIVVDIRRRKQTLEIIP